MTQSSTSFPSRLETGDVLGGRYLLVSPIASGGMGDVWAATDEVLGRTVAVKVMRADGVDDDAFIARFRDEARNAAALHHPHIASVFDYGEQDEQAWIVMELVPGNTVSELIRDRGALPAAEVRQILGQSALALAAAHDAGVVHRDVKPSNIIVTPEGQAKLTDFGVSRVGDGGGHTMTGEILGTPEYLSPEQVVGRPATAASDLYALGIVAQEMLSGSRPFDRGAPVVTALAQVHDEPPPLPATVPQDLRQLVTACLRKDPARRPRDAHAVAAALLGDRADDSGAGSTAPAGMPSGGVLEATVPLAAAESTAVIAPAAGRTTTALPLASSTTTRRLPLPVVAPAEGGGPDSRAARHTAARSARTRRRRVAWIGAAAALVVAGGAIAVGSALGPDGEGAPRPAASTAPATPAASKASTAVPTTSTPATSTTSAATTAAVAPAPQPSVQKPVKGKGKGNGKGNGR